jgi:hypothetical protein
MRAVETDEEDSDDRSDILEMHPRSKTDRNGVVVGGKDVGGNNHTEEYWKAEGGRGVKSKADWVKEEEGLNRGHKASESFAVLNELVVVPIPPFYSPKDTGWLGGR